MKEESRMKVRNVLVAVLSIFILIFIGIGCYASVVNLFGVEVREDSSSMEKKVIATDILLDRKVCNLIYSVDRKNQEIDGVILEFFNADTYKLDYVTVPSNLKLVVNNDMLKKLKTYGYKVEKSISPRKFIEFFGDKDAYQFGQMILEDVLGIKISYYTVFDNDILAKYFVVSPVI